MIIFSNLNLIMLIGGVFFGRLLASSTKLSGALGMSLLLPLCFVLKPDAALIAIISIYCGTIVSGLGMLTGAIIASVFVAFLVPVVASLAVNITSPEFLSLGIFVMTSIIFSTRKGKLFFAVTSAAAGIIVPTIGVDIGTGSQRYSFGIEELQGGIDFVVVAIGVCCIGEILYRLVYTDKEENISELSSLSSDSAVSAKSVGEIVPAISLGMPCTSETAIITGMFSLYGITGESFASWTIGAITAAAVLVSFIFSFAVFEPCSKIMTNLNKRFSRDSFLSLNALYPAFVTVAFCGIYSLNYRVFDMFLLMFFGAVGLAMRVFNFPIAPFMVGLVLSAKLEQAYRVPFQLSWLNITLYALTLVTVFAYIKLKSFNNGNDMKVNKHNQN